MTGPKDIAIAALALVAIVIGTMYGCQSQKIETLNTKVQLFEQREKDWTRELGECAVEVEDLRTAIDVQNDSVRLAAEMGEQAQAAQRQNDELANRLASSESRLQRLIEDEQRFTEIVSGSDTCQTYELVLRSIIGEVP